MDREGYGRIGRNGKSMEEKGSIGIDREG